jgi:hypothetical protein
LSISPESFFFISLQGLSLKNIKISLNPVYSIKFLSRFHFTLYWMFFFLPDKNCWGRMFKANRPFFRVKVYVGCWWCRWGARVVLGGEGNRTTGTSCSNLHHHHTLRITN